MKYIITYGLYEEPNGEFTKECNSLDEAYAFIGIMEGLVSWYEIYNENGEEID